MGTLHSLENKISRVVDRCKQLRVFLWMWYSFWALLLMVSLLCGMKKATKELPDSAYIIILIIVLPFVRKIRYRLSNKWSYFQKKSSAIYILLFMALLLFCVPLLIMKLDIVAGPISNFAYAFLIIGVGIEFYQLIKQKKAETRNNTENSETI